MASGDPDIGTITELARVDAVPRRKEHRLPGCTMRPVDEGRGRLPAEQGFSRELIRIQKVTANLGDDFVVCPDSVEEPSPVRRWPAQGCDTSLPSQTKRSWERFPTTSNWRPLSMATGGTSSPPWKAFRPTVGPTEGAPIACAGPDRRRQPPVVGRPGCVLDCHSNFSTVQRLSASLLGVRIVGTRRPKTASARIHLREEK